MHCLGPNIYIQMSVYSVIVNKKYFIFLLLFRDYFSANRFQEYKHIDWLGWGWSQNQEILIFSPTDQPGRSFVDGAGAGAELLHLHAQFFYLILGKTKSFIERTI